ncbi:MAG TPA: carboxypeptidase regulatory-like domain-containing protein [Terracidiphilus sp.]|nr:carboxypeptidase regulatory-like domain-containing protein [Terracidiphilus sp.]
MKLVLCWAGIGALAWAGCASAQVAVQGAHREISGVVVSAKTGEPLAGAQVVIIRTRDRKVVAQASSDGEGSFVFANMEDGKFDLSASREGYIRASYQQHEGGISTAIVTGEGMISTGLRFELEPQARIYGRVEEDSGDPVPRAHVSLFRADRNGGTGRMVQARAASVDAVGNFEFAGLEEGEYYACATGSPWYAQPSRFMRSAPQQSGSYQSRALLDVAYATTCYPEATNPKEAEPIRVGAGERLSLNITMHPEPAMHLIVPLPASDGQHGFAPPQLTREIFGVAELVPTESSFTNFTVGSQNGETSRPTATEITGFTAGQLDVQLPGQDGEAMRHMSVDAESTSLNLETSGATPMAEFTGQVKMADGGGLPPGAFLSLIAVQGNESQATSILADGSFKIQSLKAGRYEVGLAASGHFMAIDQLSAKGAQVGGETLTVGTEPVTLTAIIRDANTTVSGLATRKGVPTSGIFVLLVPSNIRTMRARLQPNQSDSDGSFNFQNVAPGAYTIVAIEEGWKLNWARPEVLEPYLSHGEKVSVDLKAQEVNLSHHVEAQPMQ